LLRKLQRIRSAIFAGAPYTSFGSWHCGRLVWLVTEFAGHGDDASTEEKRAASERAPIRVFAGKFISLQP
jgi:hypothetical protein